MNRIAVIAMMLVLGMYALVVGTIANVVVSSPGDLVFEFTPVADYSFSLVHDAMGCSDLPSAPC